MECKDNYSFIRSNMVLRINRNIMECKDIYDQYLLMVCFGLIETLWNVKFARASASTWRT